MNNFFYHFKDKPSKTLCRARVYEEKKGKNFLDLVEKSKIIWNQCQKFVNLIIKKVLKIHQAENSPPPISVCKNRASLRIIKTILRLMV